MKYYKIKDEFKGLTITKKIFILNANVTLDTSKEFTQEDLKAYFRLDEFKTIIEEIEEPIINNVEFIEELPQMTITINEDDDTEGITNITFIKTDDPQMQFIHFNDEIKTNEKQDEQKPKRGRRKKTN